MKTDLTYKTSETQDFARRLMKEVWATYDHMKVHNFYQPDVTGHHGKQIIHLADIENRLMRDRIHWKDPVYDIKDLIVGEDKFSIRFTYAATQIQTGKRDEGIETMYFYHLKDSRISEFWTLASIDYDYFEKE